MEAIDQALEFGKIVSAFWKSIAPAFAHFDKWAG